MGYSNVSAVIVTKGDKDLTPIINELPFNDIVIWDNSVEPVDYKIYGRYLALSKVRHNIVYTQDDDAIVDIPAVLKEYTTVKDKRVVCNMPADRRREYADGIQLVGWGCVFHKELAGEAFAKYFDKYPADELFYRECDRVFTYLNRCHLVDVPFIHLDYAHGMDRMGRESRHRSDMIEIRKRLYSIVRYGKN